MTGFSGRNGFLEAHHVDGRSAFPAADRIGNVEQSPAAWIGDRKEAPVCLGMLQSRRQNTEPLVIDRPIEGRRLRDHVHFVQTIGKLDRRQHGDGARRGVGAIANRRALGAQGNEAERTNKRNNGQQSSRYDERYRTAHLEGPQPIVEIITRIDPVRDRLFAPTRPRQPGADKGTEQLQSHRGEHSRLQHRLGI